MNGTISPSTAPAPIQAAAFELNVRTITVFSICLSAPSRSLCFLGIGATTTLPQRRCSFLHSDQIQTLSRHSAQLHKSVFGRQVSTRIRILGPLTRTSCYRLIELPTLSPGTTISTFKSTMARPHIGICATRQSKKNAPVHAVPAKQFDIPYFAHMQLDPAHFPEGGSPFLVSVGQNTGEA